MSDLSAMQNSNTATLPRRMQVIPGSVSLVIPAYNDETTIGKLITDADALLK